MSTYDVCYVIGSGAHANGYITTLGDHLFQSPVRVTRVARLMTLRPGMKASQTQTYATGRRRLRHLQCGILQPDCRNTERI